ncbi:MAG: tripartite tricarboxylate transporter TctB family protein [Christensenellaceae bacterium]|nr:tripartite tricarboxylate transporter TctB family protein [Christensenellaceae bacterium]
MFELILNVLLFLFLVYAAIFNVLEAPVPDKVERNPYALQPGVWPTVLIVMLLVLIGFNIVKILKEKKGKDDFCFSSFLKGIPAFFKGKLFVGMLLVVIASVILEPLGYMVTCFFLLFTYAILLGDKNIVRNIIVSLALTLFLYLFFGVLLKVNLPRGTVPALRNFALWLESILP